MFLHVRSLAVYCCLGIGICLSSHKGREWLEAFFIVGTRHEPKLKYAVSTKYLGFIGIPLKRDAKQ